MTWTLRQSLTGISGNQDCFICYDNDDYIYFLDDDGSDVHVYQLEVSTNTKTKISENASFTSTIVAISPANPGNVQRAPQGSLVFFNGRVYVVTGVFSSSSTFRLYEWTGSGTTWTLRDTLSASYPSGSVLGPWLAVVGLQLIFLTAEWNIDGTFDYQIRYSSDGVTFNDGTIDSGPSFPPGSYGSPLDNYLFGPNNGQGGLWLYDTIGGGFIQRLLKWNSSSNNFDLIYSIVDGVGDTWINSVFLIDMLNWYDGGTYNYEQATLTNTSSSPNDTGIIPVRTFGFTTKSIGQDTDGGQLLFHIMSPVGTWDAGEQIAALTTGWVRQAVRFTETGDTWLFFESLATTTVSIYQSDEPIEDAAVPGGDVSVGSKLWIYKTLDRGLSWNSKGVYT